MQRYDTAPIKARFDESGYLRDEPIVARVGIMEYRNTDGSVRRELRLPEDVFRSDSLEAFAGLPITIGHAAMVNSANYKRHSVGTAIGAGRQDGDGVRVPVIVQDSRGVDYVKTGKARELSVGYKIEYEPRPGFWNSETGEVKFNDERGDSDSEFIGKEWQEFDGVQRDIVPNHIAIVRRARAGSIARLNLDGDEEITYDELDFPSTTGDMMKKIRLDNGCEYEVAPEVAAHIEQLSTASAETQTRLDAAEAEKATLQASVDALKVQVDAIPEQIEQARNDAAEKLKARHDLESKAAKIGVTDFAGKSDRDIKAAVIARTTKVNLDGKDDSYVDVAFDVAMSLKPATAAQRQIVFAPGARNDGSEEGKGQASESRQAMINKLLKN